MGSTVRLLAEKPAACRLLSFSNLDDLLRLSGDESTNSILVSRASRPVGDLCDAQGLLGHRGDTNLVALRTHSACWRRIRRRSSTSYIIQTRHAPKQVTRPMKHKTCSPACMLSAAPARLHGDVRNRRDRQSQSHLGYTGAPCLGADLMAPARLSPCS